METLKKIDLHIHTRASSDGELYGEEILKLAVKEGVGTIAITDHDSISEVSGTMEKAFDYGVEVIPGTEIFCKEEETFIHMLGYYYELDAIPINELINRITETRGKWLKEQLKVLRAKGFYAEEEKAYEFSKDSPPLFSAAAYAVFNDIRNRDNPLIEDYRKYKNPVHEMSVRLLAYGKPFFTPHYIPSAAEFIDAMKKSGGVPVLAHPGYDQMRIDFDHTSFIDHLVNIGLSGVEVYYTTHTEKEEKKYIEYCKSRGLIYTAGSDFHGKYKPDIRIGQNNITDYGIISNLKHRRDEIRGK